MSKSKNIFLESMTKIYILAATKIVNVISYLEEIFEVINGCVGEFKKGMAGFLSN